MESISYTELTVTELAAGKAFYAAAFGWEFNDYGPGYAGIRTADGGSEQGGLTLGGPVEAGSNGPLVLLETADLAAAHTAVVEAGGAADEPLSYPGGSRFLFTDPFGNRLGVFRADH